MAFAALLWGHCNTVVDFNDAGRYWPTALTSQDMLQKALPQGAVDTGAMWMAFVFPTHKRASVQEQRFKFSWSMAKPSTP